MSPPPAFPLVRGADYPCFPPSLPPSLSPSLPPSLPPGCLTSHDEIRGRATTESVTLDNGFRPYGTGRDGHGHGTHCAGTAAGTNVGIAPDATVRCLKVLADTGSGQLFHVVAGLDYVGRWKQVRWAGRRMEGEGQGRTAGRE
jgi:hypothetical protein